MTYRHDLVRVEVDVPMKLTPAHVRDMLRDVSSCGRVQVDDERVCFFVHKDEISKAQRAFGSCEIRLASLENPDDPIVRTLKSGDVDGAVRKFNDFNRKERAEWFWEHADYAVGALESLNTMIGMAFDGYVAHHLGRYLAYQPYDASKETLLIHLAKRYEAAHNFKTFFNWHDLPTDVRYLDVLVKHGADLVDSNGNSPLECHLMNRHSSFDFTETYLILGFVLRPLPHIIDSLLLRLNESQYHKSKFLQVFTKFRQSWYSLKRIMRDGDGSLEMRTALFYIGRDAVYGEASRVVNFAWSVRAARLRFNDELRRARGRATGLA